MTNPPNDPETLQQLLANAFAVQESQIDPHSLTAIMQIQALLASGKLDVDSVMAHIVDSARHVANASGIAVALLKRDRLTYRAGSGTSAPLIGHQVTASLTVSPGTKTNCEILRVENADIDTRIEADICRQFGANALLIVPIYQNGTLAGVLDIRFSEPHAFDVPEVRAYRLMAEQIEAALFHAAQFEQTQLVPTQIEPSQSKPDQLANIQVEENQPLVRQSTSPADDFEEIAPLDDDFVAPPDFLMLPENEHSLYARCGALFADIMLLPVFKQTAWLATAAAQRAKSLRPARPHAPAQSEIPEVALPQKIAEPELAMPKLEVREWSPEHLQTEQDAWQIPPTQEWPPEVIASQETIAASPAEELQPESFAQELPTPAPAPAYVERALLPAPISAWRARTSAWRENLRTTAHDASTEFFSIFKNAAASASVFAQRARKSNWPRRLHATAHDASSQLSSTFKQAASSAAALSQRARNSSLPNRLRMSAKTSARNLAVEFSAVRRRAALSAAQVAQRARNSNWPGRLRSTSRDAASEFSSIFRRAVSSAALLMQRARNRRWPNASRDIAMAAAVVFAFTTVLAYRSRVPAKPPESSTSTNAAVTTSTNAAATDPQPQLSKPMAGTDASPTSAPLSTKTTAHAGTSLKRVQVGPNEVDYIGDDVTVRTFPDRSHAKRPRLAATRTTRVGDDVTVRYFTPQTSTKTASR